MNVVQLTAEQKNALDVARVGFMAACPFYAHYFYAEMQEVFTTDIPTAATDGRRIFINPVYLTKMKPAERIFIYAHEVDHVILKDPQRAKHYRTTGMKVRDKPYDHDQVNQCMDYRINAGLMEQGVGMMNPAWLYEPDVTGDDVWEEVYQRKYKKPPPGQGGKPGGAPGKGGNWGNSGKASKGQKVDEVAAANGGGFDQVLEPFVDPVTGKEDLPDEQEFKEAIARAYAAAKAQGNLPAGLERRINDILEPQVDWRDHIRLAVTGRIGSARESWDRPNRRRLVLSPMVITPGRRGNGANLVVVGVDTSGSITPKELSVFLTEVGGILQDVKPKRVIVIGCDAKVTQVDELRTLDELGELRRKGVKGGGGTRFEPVFHYLTEHNLRPECMIYLTDMMGSFPDHAPAYPVVWAATTNLEAPFGEVVRIKIDE